MLETIGLQEPPLGQHFGPKGQQVTRDHKVTPLGKYLGQIDHQITTQVSTNTPRVHIVGPMGLQDTLPVALFSDQSCSKSPHKGLQITHLWQQFRANGVTSYPTGINILYQWGNKLPHRCQQITPRVYIVGPMGQQFILTGSKGTTLGQYFRANGVISFPTGIGA